MPNLATSGSCPTRSRRDWVLISTPQQGRQKSAKIRMLLCRIIPTPSRFLLPNVCVQEQVEKEALLLMRRKMIVKNFITCMSAVLCH